LYLINYSAKLRQTCYNYITIRVQCCEEMNKYPSRSKTDKLMGIKKVLLIMNFDCNNYRTTIYA